MRTLTADGSQKIILWPSIILLASLVKKKIFKAALGQRKTFVILNLKKKNQ